MSDETSSSAGGSAGSAPSPARLPNLLIVGVGKAGTTSLFHYLAQHPDVCASSVKEPRYFRFADAPDAELDPLDSYERLFSHCGTARYVMEASPQYFKGGARTIEAIRETLERPRIILLLRDPVTRMWSEYRFKKSRLTIPSSLTFDAYVEECERVRDSRAPRTNENQAFYWLAGGSYADHIGPWLDAFGDDIHVWFFEDLVADPKAFVEGVCRWLGIDESVAASFNYSIENKTEEVRSRALQRVALSANKEGGPLRNRRGFKAPLRRVYYAFNRRRSGERMSPDTRLRLQATFASSNGALIDELDRRGYSGFPPWLRPADTQSASRDASG